MAPAFDPTRDAEAAQEFVYAGKTYAIGAPFPHKALRLTAFDLAALWRTRRIRFVDPPAPSLDVELDRLTPAQLADLEAATAPAKPARAAKRR